MILTAASFSKMAKDMWGRDWPTALGVKLKKAPKTLQRWGKNGPPASARAMIEAALEDQVALGARYLDEMRAVSEEF